MYKVENVLLTVQDQAIGKTKLILSKALNFGLKSSAKYVVHAHYQIRAAIIVSHY